MEKKKDKGMAELSGLMQIYLRVNNDEYPQLVTRSLEEKSCPPDHIFLSGCMIEREDRDFYDYKSEGMRVCQKVAEVCREGAKALAEVPQRSAIGEHLAYAYSILCDYLKEFDGDYTMSMEAAETLIRGAIDRVVRAGKCFGFELGKYRSDNWEK